MIRRMERLCGYARKVSTVIEITININVHGSCTQSLSYVIPIALTQPYVTESSFLRIIMERAGTRTLVVRSMQAQPHTAPSLLLVSSSL